MKPFIWPLSKIRKLEDQVVFEQGKVAALEKELDKLRNVHENHKGHMRRLMAHIVKDSALVVFFVVCSTCFSQPVVRTWTTTNYSWFTVNPTNNTTYYGSEFATTTNNMGVDILADNFSSDGSLIAIFTPNFGRGTQDASQYFSNSPPQDCVVFGSYPGAAVGGAVIVDSGFYGVSLAPSATNIQNSLIYGGWNVAANAAGLYSCFVMGSGTGNGLRGNGNGDFYMGIASGPGNNSPNLTNQMCLGNSSNPGRGYANMVIGNTSTIIATSGTNNTLVAYNGTIPVGITNLFLLGNQYQVVGTWNQFIGTNGFASYATNINSSIANTGFTNDVAHGWGTNNMIVDIIAVGETVAFYNRSGANGQTSCGTLLFTDTGIANKEYNVGVNCGVAFSVGTFTSGTARAF